MVGWLWNGNRAGRPVVKPSGPNPKRNHHRTDHRPVTRTPLAAVKEDPDAVRKRAEDLLKANLYIAHLDHDADLRQAQLIRNYLAQKKRKK